MTVTDSKLEAFINALAEDLSPDGANDFLMLLKAAGTLKKLKPDTLTALAGGIPTSGWIPAGVTWTYESGDDPTYSFSEPIDATSKYFPGMRLKCTQGGSVKYGIVSAVGAYSGGKTIITAYWGTDYDLGATITLPYYSPIKAPAGFPLDPNKWMVEIKDTANRTQATPTQNTWYNVGSITINIPIGVWFVSYQAHARIGDATASTYDINTTLSTANNSNSDDDFMTYVAAGDAIKTLSGLASRNKYLTLAAKTPYYLNIRTTVPNVDNIWIRGDLGATILRAVCAYL